MLKTSSRLPISTTNVALVSVLFAGALACALTRNWVGAVVLSVTGVLGLVSALYARRQSSRDVTRINAIEYRDERDRRLARHGFAIVGAAALVLSVLEVVLSSVFGGVAAIAFASGQLFLLVIIWGAANSWAVKRR